MANTFDSSLILHFFPKLVSYLPITLMILVTSIAVGILIGFAVAIPRLYKIPFVNQIAVVYVSFMRGTPILIQLFLVYYGLPALLQGIQIDLSKTDPLVFVVITYSLNIGASFSEILRGAINSVEIGQAEAGYSIGLTPRQTFTRIVLPQALIIALPNFGNLLIGSLKDTSLAFVIGVMDMTGKAETLIAATVHALEVYITLSIIYYVIAIMIEKLLNMAENRMQLHEQKYLGMKESYAK